MPDRKSSCVVGVKLACGFGRQQNETSTRLCIVENDVCQGRIQLFM